MKIVIDAGHNYSGYDTGAVGNGLREQDITYSVGMLVGEALKKRGIQIRYTRESITANVGNSLNASLSGRYSLANDWKADYFISLHCNAGGGMGAETLVYKLGGIAEGLARSVQKALVVMGLSDRGIKTRPELAVLKNANMPSVLVEMGFIDSANDSDILRNRQGDIANAIVGGICKFLNVTNNIDESEESEMIYNYIDENMPEWARPTIQKLVNKGFLKGNENGELGLNETMLKIFIVNDRAGVYGE